MKKVLILSIIMSVASYSITQQEIDAQQNHNILLNKSYIDEETTHIHNNKLAIQEVKEDVENEKVKVEQNTTRIEEVYSSFHSEDTRITSNTNRIECVQDRADKGVAIALATTHAVNMKSAEQGDIIVGIGVGGYQNASAVAIGIGTQLSDNLSLTASYSLTQGSDSEHGWGAGANYKF